MRDNSGYLGVIWFAAIVLTFALFYGSPDMIDALIFKMTGVKTW